MLQKRNPYDIIAVNLRIAWSDAITGPLPNRIRRLLEQIADQEAKRSTGLIPDSLDRADS
jgi:hypothetical protein